MSRDASAGLGEGFGVTLVRERLYRDRAGKLSAGGFMACNRDSSGLWSDPVFISLRLLLYCLSAVVTSLDRNWLYLFLCDR